MKLHQLKTLASIADTGSIRATARELGLSPAAVTKAVRELESDTHASLVIRSPSGITFTECGRALLVHARLVVGQLDRAQQELDTMQGAARGKLSIGITPWVALTFLPDAVNLFRRQMPDVQLEFFEGLLGLVIPRLRDGSLDFSIGKPPPAALHAEFVDKPLFSTSSAVVARRGHPKEACRSIRELQDEEWLLNWDPASRESIENSVFGRHGMAVPRVIHLSHSLVIAIGLIANTDMLSIFPWPLAEVSLAKESLRALPIRESVDETIVSVLSRHGVPFSPAAECFTDCLTQAIRNAERSNSPEQRRLFHSMELLI